MVCYILIPTIKKKKKKRTELYSRIFCIYLMIYEAALIVKFVFCLHHFSMCACSIAYLVQLDQETSFF